MTRERVSQGSWSAADAERVLCHFDQAWQSGAAPRMDAFWPPPSGSATPASRRQLLEELLKIDLEYRWRTGQPLSASGGGPRLEDYLAGYPELGPVEQLPLALIEEEYRARHCWGDRPAHTEYLTRFARQATLLLPALKRIDAELASERLQVSASLTPADRTPVRPPLVVEPTTAIVSLAALIDQLRVHRLLGPAQLTEVERGVVRRGAADPRSLGVELLRRGWLTPYQLNQLLLGRGAELVLGPYVLLERLGEGGTGQVFKARQQGLDRIVAIKRIRRELVIDAEVVRRFYREAQLISQLSHPNIVHAYDAGPIGPAHVLVTEYVEGTDLSKLVKQVGPLPVEQACAYLRQAALGLQYLHERGLVHRDIKPSNLMLVKAGGSILKVLDLGLARFYRNEGGELTNTMTPEGPVTMGTADFMAPEQALDFHEADIRADIYSLGCTFFYLLTGQPPYLGGSLAQKLLRHQTEVPAVERLRPDVPSAVVAILRRMLAKSPANRYQTPVEVATALAPLVGRADSPRGPWWARFASARSRARPGWQALSAKVKRPLARRRLLALAIIVCMVVASGWWFWPRDYFHRWPRTAMEVLCQQPWKVRCVAISPDGQVVAMAGDGEAISVWDVAARRESVAFRGHKGRIGALAFSPDGQTLAAAGDHTDGTVVRLWDMARGEAKVLKGHHTAIYSVAFAADGKTLASGGWEGAVKLWDVESGRERSSLVAHKGQALSVAFLPSGPTVLSSGSDRIVQRWNADTGKGKALVSGLDWGSLALACSPDGQTFAVAENRTLRLYDTTDGTPQDSFTGTGGSILAVAYAPQGRTLAATDDQGHIVAWDPLSRNKLQEWRLPNAEGSVSCLAFAGNGRHLVTARDGTVYILRLTPPAGPGK